MTAANRARRSIRWGATLGLALTVGLVPAAAAAEPVVPVSRLETPMADVALLEPPAPDAGATPLLLVLDADGPAAHLAHLSILRRERAWDLVAELEVDLERDDLTARWLVALGDRRFALIATSPASSQGAGHAAIVGIDVEDEFGRTSLAAGGRARLDHAIEAAGAADVDGFGTAELVLGLRPTLDASASCGTSSLRMLDGESLDVRRSMDLPGRLGAGALGRWDEVPGDDLLVYASPECPPAGPGGDRLLALRLRDGSRSSVVEIGSGPDVTAYPPPLRLRLDGAARDRALVALAGTIAVIDAVDGHPVAISDMSGVPLAAGPDPDSEGPATRVAWIDGDGLHAERVRGGPHGSIVRSARTDLAFDAGDAGRAALLLKATYADVRATGLSSALLGDVIADGCPDLILPGAILPCGSADLRPGAAWLATRPMAAMTIEGRRGLLVAAGLGWDPDEGLPGTPTPWASGPDGWWRRGASTPFAVSEVRGNDVMYFRDFPIPTATIETTTAGDGTTLLPGFTGTRLFVSVTPLADGEEGPDVAPSRLDALSTGAGPSGIVTIVRVPIAPGNESGRDGSYATLSLGEVRRRGAGETSHWALQVVPINDWGEVGLPVVRTITRDAVGPTLNLDTPFTNPVWPFLAKLPGRAEPGSTVSVAGVGDIDVDRRGRFTVVTRLAPWPQTIRINATDASGNTSVAEFSVVGGIDYRRFPWALIIALSLLALVAARGLAAAGQNRASGVPATPWSTGVLDEASVPEIEELPPGSGLARG